MKVGEEMEVDKEEMVSMTAGSGQRNSQFWLQCHVKLRKRGRSVIEKLSFFHSLFIDVSVFKSVEAIKCLMENDQRSTDNSNSSILYEERIGDLLISVAKDVPDASTKLDSKNGGSLVLGMSHEDLTKRNLLKGITADESATVHVLW
ncbi:unnamed protein product [Fraxinus pennsylvanica]|uniref:Uncharacterized protein n=1 Tax=Fraxinus pennsylvanica TaxID=56036 RepID=A0AAD1Z2B4_9LAMI|nr:unnamed protein product [Fraxinus pennsylvanica]